VKTRDDAFVAGQEVWHWDGARMARRQIENVMDWNREGYTLVKTTSYSKDVTIGMYLYAYPQDRDALLDAMYDDVSSIQRSIRELEKEADL